MIEMRQSRYSALPMDIVTALLTNAAALAVAETLYSVGGITRVAVLFLGAVTVVGSIRGVRAAIMAGLSGVLFYKLFIDLRTPDQTSVTEDVLNLLVFLVVALITGTLAGRMHDEAAKSRLRAARMDSLFRASRTLAEEDERTFWPTVAEGLSSMCRGPALVINRDGAVRASHGRSSDQQTEGLELGLQMLQKGITRVEHAGGWGACLFGPRADPAGALVWASGGPDAELEGVVTLLSELVTASVIRVRAREEQLRRQAAEEANKLREALLSSISHDFRSPLAAIIASSTSLLEFGPKFDRSVTEDLLLNIQQEGEKLNDFIGNLLTITKIESGAIAPSKERLSVKALLDSGIERLERHLGRPVPVNMDGECEVEADASLLQQVLHNLLDNAMKHGNGKEGITVRCSTAGEFCQIIIADRGPGVADADLEGMFEKFYFAKSGARVRGTGLGMSIARGFAEAMGGTIRANNRSDGQTGLEVAITLPRFRS